MHMYLKSCIGIVLVLFNLVGHTQVLSIDSLFNALLNTPESVVKLHIYNEVIWELRKSEPDKAIAFGDTVLLLADKLLKKTEEATEIRKELAISLNRIGLAYKYNGEGASALEFFQKSLDIALEMDDKDGMESCYLNIATFYQDEGMYDKSTNYCLKSLDIATESGDGWLVASVLDQIGINYEYQGDYPLALKHYLKALKINEKLLEGDNVVRAKSNVMYSYINIGILYAYLNDSDQALSYFRQGVKISHEMNSKEGLSHCLNNIGRIYNVKGNYIEALEYFQRSLAISEELGDRAEIASKLNNIGIVHYENGGSYELVRGFIQRSLSIKLELGNKFAIISSLNNLAELMAEYGVFDSAIAHCETSLLLAKEIYAKEEIMYAYKNMSLIYEKMGTEHKHAYKYYKLYSAMKDSLFNETKSKEIGKLEAKYEFEKTEEEKKRVELEAARLKDHNIRRRNILQYTVIVIVFVLIFAFILVLTRISISARLLEGLIFFSFLLFFEFTLVLLDPYIDKFSSGAPAIKLAFNALLAGLIFPLHSFFETKLKKKLAKGNT